MKFMEGRKMGSLNKREVPLGCWWCAEIISGNRHNRDVRYHYYSPYTGVTVEGAPAHSITPFPPPVVEPSSWVPGYIVEVFENNSWSFAEIVTEAGVDYFFVRLLDSSRKFRAHVSDLRLWQACQDNKWVVIQKECEEGNKEITNNQSKAGDFRNQIPRSCVKVKTCRGDDHCPKESDSGFGQPYFVPSKFKRRQEGFCSGPISTCTRAHKKIRAFEDAGRHSHLMERCSPHLLEKVDAVASPSRPILGAKYVHASLNHRTNGHCEIGMNERKLNVDVDNYFLGNLGSDDDEATSSSVGSCSANAEPCRLPHHPTSQPRLLDSHFEDTASSSRSGRELAFPTREGAAEEIHHLELNAYRSTMIAFYASGPLSWEQEALLTDLRIMLHISNDEHLRELRRLRSAKKGF